jgi:hypothetical protein
MCLSESGLPEPAAALIGRVVRRSRLWKREKIAIAEELIAHFHDGLDAGATIEELVRGFGDERQAARLIRRAKIRGRPLIWQAFRVLRLMVAGVILFYIGLAGVYFSGRPSPRTNYTALLNQQIEKTPIDQRAWPVYRQAILGLWPDRSSNAEYKRTYELLKDRPANALQPELTDWLTSHPEAIELVRQGSRLPSMGYVLGPGGSAYDMELWPDQMPTAQTAGAAGDPLISVQLAHLNVLRQVAWVLDADAQLATQQKDGARVAADIQTIAGMGRQISGVTAVESLVGMAMLADALKRAETVLMTSPELLSNAELTDIAHVLSGPTVAADLVNLRGERMFVADFLQRTYTDDGTGDGRLTPEGARLLNSVNGSRDDGSPDASIVQGSFGPAAMLVMASRRELQEAYDQYVDAAEAQLRRPARVADWETPDAMAMKWHSSSVEGVRYMPLLALAPYFPRLATTAERYLGKRDGVLIGIALELYRREHGGYPQTLALLSPTLLPEVPVDRITGGPLVYKLVDGRPLVYSVGADRDDDGGRVPQPRPGETEPSPLGAAEWGASDPRDGDWPVYGGP